MLTKSHGHSPLPGCEPSHGSARGTCRWSQEGRGGSWEGEGGGRSWGLPACLPGHGVCVGSCSDLVTPGTRHPSFTLRSQTFSAGQFGGCSEATLNLQGPVCASGWLGCPWGPLVLITACPVPPGCLVLTWVLSVWASERLVGYAAGREHGRVMDACSHGGAAGEGSPPQQAGTAPGRGPKPSLLMK